MFYILSAKFHININRCQSICDKINILKQGSL